MKNIFAPVRAALGKPPIGVIVAAVFTLATAIPLIVLYCSQCGAKGSLLLESAARAALLEYDAETAETAQTNRKAALVRPIIVGYELSTSGGGELKLLLLFPSDTWAPTFGVRFSERLPGSHKDSISASYAESVPALVHAHGFYPAGGIGHFTVRAPALVDLNKIKALELFDTEFRPLGVVPVSEANRAFAIPRSFLEVAAGAWQPLLRFYGTIPSAWVASSDGLPMYAPLQESNRPPRSFVEQILREETNRLHWLAGRSRVVEGVAK